MAIISDKYGRSFRTLRVSLLQRCNLGCVYCVDEGARLGTASAGVYAEGEGDAGFVRPVDEGGSARLADEGNAGALLPGASPVQPVAAVLGREELLAIIGRLHGLLDLETVRLTGGEPLLFRGLPELIAGLRTMGIAEIKLTTNGFLLDRLAAPMRAAGLSSINVSLDAVDEAVFFRMSRRHHVDRVIAGINVALAAGLDVKLNSVIMKGINDSQLLPLLELAFDRGIPIRFLEVMTMGHLYHQPESYLFTQEEMLERIGERFAVIPLGRADGATARYWQVEGRGIFGIIANETQPFCSDCNRLRLDSEGKLYGCLSSNHPIAMDMGESDEVWENHLKKALAQKQAIRFTGSELSMLYIGG